jgi:hypothetical protein
VGLWSGSSFSAISCKTSKIKLERKTHPVRGIYWRKAVTKLNLKTFFNSDAVALPIRGRDDAEEDFVKQLDSIFLAYTSELPMLDDPAFPEIAVFVREVGGKIADLTISISTAVRLYLSGNPLAAYEVIDLLLQNLDLKQFITNLSVETSPINLSDPFSLLRASIFHPVFYRIRSERIGFADPGRCDIFHVPFEKRRLVGNQRYSIPGLPCLYVGSSLWICWEELQRPAFDSVWVSRFRLASPVKILDFQFPPQQIWRIFDAFQQAAPNALDHTSEEALKSRFSIDFVKAYILCWPLIASCSVRSSTHVGNFRPEYIVPQMLLQWVTRKLEVDGIRYFSVRTPSGGPYVYAHSNLVFPARTYSSSGYCEYLSKKFSLTVPISWELLEATNLGEKRVLPDQSPNRFAFVQASRDLLLGYSQTAFSVIEDKLEEIEKRPNCSRSVSEAEANLANAPE